MREVHTEPRRIPSHIRNPEESKIDHLRLFLGILHISKGTAGRTSEHRGTTRSTRSSRSPAAPAAHVDMHPVQIAIIGQIGQRQRPEESADPPQGSLKTRQLEIEIELSVETRVD